jgi:hypothetical protein
VADYDPANVVAKGRVKPGQMVAADLETGRLLMPEDIDNELKAASPTALAEGRRGEARPVGTRTPTCR